MRYLLGTNIVSNLIRNPLARIGYGRDDGDEETVTSV